MKDSFQIKFVIRKEYGVLQIYFHTQLKDWIRYENLKFVKKEYLTRLNVLPIILRRPRVI